MVSRATIHMLWASLGNRAFRSSCKALDGAPAPSTHPRAITGSALTSTELCGWAVSYRGKAKLKNAQDSWKPHRGAPSPAKTWKRETVRVFHGGILNG